MRSPRWLVYVHVSIVCGLAGCTENGQPPAPPVEEAPLVEDAPPVQARAPSVTGPAEFEGTVGDVDVPKEDQFVATLVAVRTARHVGFDRIVFVFSGPVPGYRISYIDRPVRQCASGDPVPLAGDAWLEIRMTPANAHDKQGAPTIEARARRVSLAVVEELKLTCDFEAIVTWVLGVGTPNAYRFSEFSDPSRLVVDIAHR
jgi:hypothetical protein